MKFEKFPILLAVTLLGFTTHAQQITCDSFCITDIQEDANNVWNISLAMEGSNTDFINYPYISLITDENGDTLATGILNFFGQFGGTTTVYQVTAIVDSFPENFGGTIYFTYDEIVCELSYPCIANGIANLPMISEYSLEVYPVPSSGSATIILYGVLDKTALHLFNSSGQLVNISPGIFSGKTTIDLNNLANDFYYLQLTKDNVVVASGKLIVLN